MSNNAPAWLGDSNNSAGNATSAAAAQGQPNNDFTSNYAGSPDTVAAAATLPVQEEPGLANAILIMRVANMSVMMTLTTCSILVMMNLPNPAQWVLASFAVCTSTLVFCLETQLKFVRIIIAMNFGFLFNPFFRFLYYVLMASIALSFDNLFGQVVGVALILVAIYNTYVLVSYPSYRKARDNLAQEEDRRIQERIGNQVQQQAVKQAVIKAGL
uniref:COPI associated protein n=1 Tax=Eucampia antarctica TaxID=49252 RepID=A0A7S2SMD0_9STRA